MRTLERRLNRVEEWTRRKKPELLGTVEDHYLRAWPPKDEALWEGLQQCHEHGPTCAVRITPVMGSIRRLYIQDIDFIPPPLG